MPVEHALRSIATLTLAALFFLALATFAVFAFARRSSIESTAGAVNGWCSAT